MRAYIDLLKYILENADITFGNLEGVILSEGGTVKSCSNPSVCYAFRMPNHYVNYFKDAGFDDQGKANSLLILKRFGIQEIKSI